MFAIKAFSFLALCSLALALPGGSSEYTPPKETPTPSYETICTPEYFTNTTVCEGETTNLSTKTFETPVTTVVDKATTYVSPCPYTSTGYDTTTIVSLFTHLTTKTTSTVTTIYDTVIESDVSSSTVVETVPTSSVGTLYKTIVGTVHETVVTTITSTSICTETSMGSVTSVITSTETVCTTKSDYGGW